MNTAPVLLKVENSVAFITLNSPKNKNALNVELLSGLSKGLDACADKNIRAVVIQAEGTSFCSGGDLEYMVLASSISDALGVLIDLLHKIVINIRLLPKPVIAAVSGSAAGAGMSLAMGCDLRIASDRAKFKQGYTSVGLVPDGGWSYWVPQIIGLARASELIFCDPVLSALRAFELGLVNKVYPHEVFIDEVRNFAFKLADGPTKAYASSKMLLNEAVLPDFENQLEREREAMMTIGKSADASEGLRAFFAKSLPEFRGR